MEDHPTFEGEPLHCRVVGNGSPLLLLHGFGEDGGIWREIAEGLSDASRVIVPDIPGSGKSPMPDSLRQDPSLDRIADGMAALLDRLGVGGCPVIGHSMGGYIALAMAERHPQKVPALGLFHSTARPDDADRKAMRERSIRFLQEMGAEAFLKEAIPGLYAEAFRREHPDAVRRHVQNSAATLGAEELVAYYRAMMHRPDRRRLLHDFDGPVLVLLGEEDKTVISQDAITDVTAVRRLSLHKWPGVAHMGMVECPLPAGEAIRGFLRGNNFG